VKGGHHFPRHIKSEEVWRKCWGKYWEPIGNLKGTRKEVKKNEKKSFLLPPTPKHKKKKDKVP